MKEIKITGMHCEHCAARVKKALSAFGATEVLLDKGLALTDTDAADDKLKEAVDDLGFVAESVTTK